MADQAQHNRADLLRIWGTEYPLCYNCAALAQDWEHVCGRGGRHLRKLHSSVYGALSYCRRCHIHKDTSRESKERILQHIYSVVEQAIDNGYYTRNKNDEEFLEKYAEYYGEYDS